MNLRIDIPKLVHKYNAFLTVVLIEEVVRLRSLCGGE